MLKTIVNKPGVAKGVRGQTVDVRKHPRFKNSYQFECMGETWIASDYAFTYADNKEEKYVKKE